MENSLDNEAVSASEVDAPDLLARIVVRARDVMQRLVRARQYAADLQCCKWEFSLSLQQLEDGELSDNDIRWLVGKHLVEHARETTVSETDERSFEPTRSSVLRDNSCFVLTNKGLKLLQDLEHPAERGDSPRVHWDATAHCLKVDGQTVKVFKLPSPNQERILSAFEEEGWPMRIDDPLPISHDIHPKRRLNDTIKGLNRNQRRTLIRFRGDGSGQGVIWEPVR